VKVLEVLFGRHAGDERSRKGQEIAQLADEHVSTIERADRALRARSQLAAELDGAVAAFRRRR
jgi:hypothetical protein